MCLYVFLSLSSNYVKRQKTAMKCKPDMFFFPYAIDPLNLSPMNCVRIYCIDRWTNTTLALVFAFDVIA